jgi:DNA-binding CsgD family transcriptional regulator
MGALISLAVLLVVFVVLVLCKPAISERTKLACAYGSVAVSVAVLLTYGFVQLMGLQSNVSVIALIALAYGAQIAGLYYWLQAARQLSPMMAITLAFVAIIICELISMFILIACGDFSYSVMALLALCAIPCIRANRQHDSGGCDDDGCDCNSDFGGSASVKTFSGKQRHGLFGLAASTLSLTRLTIISAVSIFLFATSTGILLGFVPSNFIGPTSFPSFIIYQALVQGTCAFFVYRAYKGRLWQLSFAILQVLIVLIFAAIACSILLDGHWPLNSILGHTLNALLTGFSWYLLIFFMGHGRRDPLFYCMGGMFVCLLPNVLARSVLFSLFDMTANFNILILVLCVLSLLAALTLFSLYLRAAIHSHVPSGLVQVSGLDLATVSDATSGVEGSTDGSADAKNESSWQTLLHAEQMPESLTEVRTLSTQESVKALGKQFGLSPREIEVLSLYAMGHTQRRVAEELFISQATVHAHIKNIYGKTNLCSRQKILDYLSEYTN